MIQVSEHISAGQSQQLAKMTPHERMVVLASHDFGLWFDAQPGNLGTSEKIRMKRAYVAGFFQGMDRTGRALMSKDKRPFWNWWTVLAVVAIVLAITFS